jgi:hypothetical protein
LSLSEELHAMSLSEIADNKWEVQAAKPPVQNVPAVAQMLLIASFTAIFAWILFGSLQGMFGAKRDGLAESYGKMTHDASPKK